MSGWLRNNTGNIIAVKKLLIAFGAGPTLLTLVPTKVLVFSRVQRPNGRDVKSVVAKTRTRVTGSTAVPPLPPSYERLASPTNHRAFRSNKWALVDPLSFYGDQSNGLHVILVGESNARIDEANELVEQIVKHYVRPSSFNTRYRSSKWVCEDRYDRGRMSNASMSLLLSKLTMEAVKMVRAVKDMAALRFLALFK
ncbi:hypothetical protein YC2023_026002 [Brassica napus]